MKYTGNKTMIKSPTPYRNVNHVCFFKGLASSGQLFTRSTVVSHVFDWGADMGGCAKGVSSALEPKTCRRNGFHRELVVVLMIADALRHATLQGHEDV